MLPTMKSRATTKLLREAIGPQIRIRGEQGQQFRFLYFAAYVVGPFGRLSGRVFDKIGDKVQLQNGVSNRPWSVVFLLGRLLSAHYDQRVSAWTLISFAWAVSNGAQSPKRG